MVCVTFGGTGRPESCRGAHAVPASECTACLLLAPSAPRPPLAWTCSVSFEECHSLFLGLGVKSRAFVFKTDGVGGSMTGVNSLITFELHLPSPPDLTLLLLGPASYLCSSEF